MMRICHVKNWNGDWSMGIIGSRFPQGYIEVAQVNTDSLGEAFELTNHIESDWTTNKGVQATIGDHRSSSVGDIFVTGAGEVHLVAPMGFLKMGTFKDGAFTPEKMTVWALLDLNEMPKKKLRYFYEKRAFEAMKGYQEENGGKIDSWEADLSEAFA